MPSSCHNDSNFLFPPPFCAGNSSLPSVSPFLTSPRQAPSSFSSVCCLKPSNEIHTKQDGRLNAFLSAFLFLSSASSSFAFLSYCLLLHLLVLLSLPSVLHTFLHLSSSSYFPLWAPFSSRSYSSTSPS